MNLESSKTQLLKTLPEGLLLGAGSHSTPDNGMCWRDRVYKAVYEAVTKSLKSGSAADAAADAATTAAATADAAAAAAAAAAASGKSVFPKYNTPEYWAWRKELREKIYAATYERFDKALGGAVERSRREAVEMIRQALAITEES